MFKKLWAPLKKKKSQCINCYQHNFSQKDCRNLEKDNTKQHKIVLTSVDVYEKDWCSWLDNKKNQWTMVSMWEYSVGYIGCDEAASPTVITEMILFKT